MQEVVCFHNPDEINGYLSNWYTSYFKEDELVFNSIEQYMMYYKAITFNDTETAKKIMKSSDMREIKALGRAVSNYVDEVWSSVRYRIVKKAIYWKFTQNRHLATQLLDTGDSILAECAVHDKIWGIGLPMHSPDRFDQSKWKGTNLLGKALMEIRSILPNYNEDTEEFKETGEV